MAEERVGAERLTLPGTLSVVAEREGAANEFREGEGQGGGMDEHR